MSDVLLFVGVFVALPAVVAVSAVLLIGRQTKKRRAAMRAFARTQGWQWIDSDLSYTGLWSRPPFGHGSARKAENVLLGRHHQMGVVVFDYSYATKTPGTPTPGSASSTTVRYTVWAVRMPVALPYLELGPEGGFSGRVAAAFGMADADLQVGHEPFDRAYKVRSDDARFARSVLHLGMLDLLLRDKPVQLRFDGDTLLCWEKSRVDTAQFIPRLDLLGHVLATVPQQVYQQYGRAA